VPAHLQAPSPPRLHAWPVAHPLAHPPSLLPTHPLMSTHLPPRSHAAAVALQYGHIINSVLHDVGFGVYVKGGSAYIIISGNRVYNTGELGISAGFDTGGQSRRVCERAGRRVSGQGGRQELRGWWAQQADLWRARCMEQGGTCVVQCCISHQHSQSRPDPLLAYSAQCSPGWPGPAHLTQLQLTHPL